MKQDRLLQVARAKLLALANCYEPKRRKVLRGVFFDRNTDCYRWIGFAHDYSVHVTCL